MFKFEANEAVIMAQQAAIESLLTTNAKTEKALRAIINKYIKDARDEVMRSIILPNDPRKAKHAIRRVVYKKVLGGNINILNRRRAAKESTDYEPPRKLRPGQRGGNRVKRGKRTDTIMKYPPDDRGFILRFLNDGTDVRTAGTRGGKLSGNRGRIAARDFFRGAGEAALTRMADILGNVIEDELTNIFGEG